MADHTTTRVTNLPDSGSAERVAHDLLEMIFVHEGKPKMTRAGILDLYAHCLHATTGRRSPPKT
jgi:hypothetical protein